MKRLKENGIRVLLQTIPPFDYQNEKIAMWESINQYIKELDGICDGIFDVVPVLQASPDRPHCAKYGGHPDNVGCAAWGNALYPALAEILRD